METNKITFSTLKKYARRGELLHQVEGQHGPYGMEFYRGDDALKLEKTTLEDLARFKASRNWITTDDATFSNILAENGNEIFATLSNCVYLVNFCLIKGAK